MRGLIRVYLGGGWLKIDENAGVGEKGWGKKRHEESAMNENGEG